MRTFRKDGQTMVVADVAATLLLRDGWIEVKETEKPVKAEEVPETEAEPDTPKRRRRKAN